MKTDTYIVYDLLSPLETEDERQRKIASLVKKVSRDGHVFLDKHLKADQAKPEREKMLTSLRESDILLVRSLPHLAYPKERAEIWQRIIKSGAKVKFIHRPSQKVWAVMESILEIHSLDNGWRTAKARGTNRKTAGRPKGFADWTRASIAYQVASSLLPSNEYTNEDVRELINNALPSTCKKYKTGLHWQKHVRQMAVYLGKMEHDPILGEGHDLNLPDTEKEKFIRLRVKDKRS